MHQRRKKTKVRGKISKVNIENFTATALDFVEKVLKKVSTAIFTFRLKDEIWRSLCRGHFLPSPTTYEETGMSSTNHYEGSGHVPVI